MNKVYLAGLIAEDKLEECYEWRRYAEKMLSKDFEIRNPLRDNFEFSNQDMKAIVYRDYHDVIESDLLLVNLNTFGSERKGLCGTYFEMAWAWEHRIPVISVSLDLITHPFIKECTTRFFFDYVAACNYILRHWR